MIGSYPTLPLETFRELMGFNPFWFYGMADSSEWLRPGAQVGNQGCRGVTKEFSWQDRDYAGRQDIREAISRAEQKMALQLRYWPAPKYFEDTVEWPRYYDNRFIRNMPADSDMRWLRVKVPNGWVQSAGVETRTAISIAKGVNYFDNDNDGYDDIAIIGPVATTVTDPKEIAVYFNASDRYGYDNNLSEKWRIAPLRISISNGQLTLYGPAWMFVRPVLQSSVTARDIDPHENPSPFANTVDIYRRYTDGSSTDVNQSQGVVYWETRPNHCGYCLCGSCTNSSVVTGSPYDPAATSRAVARVGIRDSKSGSVTPAESLFDVTTGTWSSINWWVCEEPDRVTIRYLAGYPLDSDGQMNPRFRELVAILAAAELARPISGCSESNRILFYWQQDLAKTGREDDLYATSADILDNPFGSRRGQVHVWREVVNLARGTGIRAG